jgi:ABC-type Co2+ transport system permease subunit
MTGMVVGIGSAVTGRQIAYTDSIGNPVLMVAAAMLLVGLSISLRKPMPTSGHPPGTNAMEAFA